MVTYFPQARAIQKHAERYAIEVRFRSIRPANARNAASTSEGPIWLVHVIDTPDVRKFPHRMTEPESLDALTEPINDVLPTDKL